MFNGVRNPSVPNPARCEEDITEFFEILATSPLPPEEALARKISIRRACVTAKAYLKEPTPKRDEKPNTRDLFAFGRLCFSDTKLK